jgi:hypothetical protein
MTSYLEASWGVNDANMKGVKRGDIIGAAVGPPGTRLSLGVIRSDDFDRR